MAEEREELGVSYVVVDGIEGRMARVELPDGGTEDWRLASLPSGVQEGDVIRIDVQAGDVEIKIDHEETDRRHALGQRQLDALNAGTPDGDINL
ncbi:DUF3006 domain-containing protein [Deinococcus radiopugnans]|uniref:DUF3006 domain-containing protein n=1 Tax=Deinococcus radiopugnans ATCC 19172 TaxID=585398 RepID=A0A5C4YB25_9DEIO|nr:DUF3006 domain-containing protein [Deinococcus radiopugnans]MBB6015966.1 hypothetical protein [Deinococcus radiopugnans ATCC 19172]TNM72345.1 DUF3006 domain-containing protein [Deinococcus radiopugnans ATCC 19172]